MENIRAFFRDLWDLISSQASGMGFADLVDILLVTLVLYYLFKFIRDRRAGRLLIGVLFLLLLQLFSERVGLVTINYVLQNVYQVGILALIILFQPELRSMLEKMGAEPLRGLKNIGEQKNVHELQTMIIAICDAVEVMAAEKTGALIVLEREVKLGDYIAPKGTVIDSAPSAFLIRNIFFNKSPLHDGALILRPPRLFAAGCVLPLSTGGDLKENLGTRHRAAIGISENSDAIAVVVSEETGVISLAFNGRLYRHFTPEQLRRTLNGVFIDSYLRKKNAAKDASPEKDGGKRTRKKKKAAGDAAGNAGTYGGKGKEAPPSGAASSDSASPDGGA